MMDVEKARKLASKAYKEYLYAGSSQNIFIEDYISTCILTACREERLEEADWWDKHIDHEDYHNECCRCDGFAESDHKCPDCDMCDRLAQLRR